jgi:DNA replication protein DnaC
VTELNSQAVEAVRRYIQDPAGGLMFLGPVGTGKTHLAACVVNAFLDQLKRVTFGGVVDLLGRIRRSYGEEAQEEEWEIIDELTTAPLLVLDDLGKERVKDWVEEILFRIIDVRYGEKRPLVITTNFSPQDLEKRYPEKGYAIVSRLAEMCTGVYLGGEDWRKAWMETGSMTGLQEATGGGKP